ncbi:hypothetical protein IC621_02550 [Bacillus sp. IB182487]|uniref:Uncharacterized protein n=1 Tax=Metabacillus arenae TaxID=2771434 RepID=A0A926RW21_9BACI|nr:hypothetical protein [Metabacillus arenae]
MRAEKARKRFNEEFSYSMLREIHIDHLRSFISQELANHDHDKEMKLSLRAPRKKDIDILKTKGLRYVQITVKGSYFDRREGITFNQVGFIGFAGWTSSYNVKPFVDAFEKWMDWLSGVVKQVA